MKMIKEKVLELVRRVKDFLHLHPHVEFHICVDSEITEADVELMAQVVYNRAYKELMKFVKKE